LDYRIWNFDDDDIAEGFTIDSNGVVESVVAFLENFTSLRQVSYHVAECVQLARTVLPTDVADFLDILIKGDNTEDTLRILSSILLSSSDTTDETVHLLAILMQMTLTRIALFRLIQLCTPESIFTNR
jgi:hypothetical protein